MIKLNLNLKVCHVLRHMFFILLAYVHACACKIDDVEALVQKTCVLTRRVHNNLHEHVCMSVTYMPNLVCMHVDEYMNCRQRMLDTTL